MTVTRGEIKGQILRVLQKDGGYQGFFTDPKLNDVIQDSIDHIAIEMFRAGDGWLTKIDYLNSQSGFPTVNLPQHMIMIQEVRYLVANTYVPLTYDDGTEQQQYAANTGMTQFPSRYRIVDQKIYFNPPPAEGGPNYIQVEYCTYPLSMVADGQLLPQEFHRAMFNYIKWRSASMLAASVGKEYSEWKQYEGEWKNNMVDMVNKRTKAPIYYRNFEG